MAQTYVVKAGDTLSKIAQQLGVSMSDISGYSSGNPNQIRVGESLQVGGGSVVPPRNDLAANNGYGDFSQGGTTGTPKVDAGPKPRAKLPNETPEQYAQYIKGLPFLNPDPTSATGYKSATQKDFNNYTRSYVPTLSKQESADLALKYGLAGTGADFAGLTADAARAKAEAKKKELLGGALGMKNSSFYDVTQLGNVKKSVDQLSTGLSALNNDPWKTAEDKKLGINDLVTKTTNSIASLFGDPQSFVTAYQSDPSLQAIMSDYVRAGGTVSDVSNRILQGQQGGAANTQSVGDYLLNAKTAGAGDNVYSASADSYLNPSRNASIDEINRLAKVPKDLVDLYYGTPDKVGVFQKIKTDAETAINNLNTAYGNTKKTTSDQFDYQVQKNTQDANIQIADLETKRLQTKNYLIEKLASIGALTTTGAAPEALANLDAKYETAKSQSLASLQNTNAMLLSKKAEALNGLESDLADKIQSIRSNLNKSDSQIEKDILDAKQSSQKAINTEIEQFNTKARTVYNEFLDVTSKTAQTYIKEFLKTVSGGLSDKYLKEFNTNLAAASKKTTTASTEKPFVSGKAKFTGEDISGLETGFNQNRGSDGYINPDIYKAAYDQWIQLGGLGKDFITKFPPKNYVNPANTTLPPVLRNTTKATTGSGRKL
jgi:hypothetical protein